MRRGSPPQIYAIRELFLSYRSQHVQATRDYFFQFNFNKTTHAKSYLRDLTSHYLSWGGGGEEDFGGSWLSVEQSGDQLSLTKYKVGWIMET